MHPTPSNRTRPRTLEAPAPPDRLDRRRFLVLGGTTIGAAVFAACSRTDDATPVRGTAPTQGTATTVTTTPTGPADADLALARTAASLEVLAVDTYQLAIDSGLLTTAAIIDAVRLFQSHHDEHLSAMNGAIREAGGTVVQDRNEAVFKNLIEPALDLARSEADVVRLAVELESTAAQTYVYAGGAFTEPALRSSVMTIGGVEARHLTVLQMLAQEESPFAVFPGRRAYFPGDNPLAGIDGALLPA